MAEKLLQHALAAEEPPLNELEVVSAGVAAGYGDPASANSIAALKKVQLDLSRHKSQPLTAELIEQAFAIFGMTQSHIDLLRHHYADRADLPERIHLWRAFMGDPPVYEADAERGNLLVDDHEIEIPDPFGQNYAAYAACFDSMAEAIPSIIEYLRKEYTP
jgi:protein-tyrosine-phosphatase